ncbi:MAG: double zinc ribbon domain-containing protein [bacterium]
MTSDGALHPRSSGGAARDLAQMVRWWRGSVAEPVLSVLFPPRCVGCRDFETHLCASCRETLTEMGENGCPRCGEPGPRPLVGGRCSHCMGAHLGFAGARSAFRHQGVARRLVAEFKSGGQPVLGRLMADLARPAFAGYASSIGSREQVLVTWVPSHRAVQRERGYNQAEVFARALAGDPKVLPSAGLVRKTAATKHQKGLGRVGRQGNLRGVFTLDERAVAGLSSGCQTLLLVDDVYTTGATAREVSSVLAAGTGLPVHVFTFSRVVAGAAEGHD